MNARPTQKKNIHVNIDHSQPWWLRVLEHQGLPTVFALVLLAGAWKIGERHLAFIDQQVQQMALQTKSLDVIAGSNLRQEQALEDVRSAVKNSDEERHREHSEILKSLK